MIAGVVMFYISVVVFDVIVVHMHVLDVFLVDAGYEVCRFAQLIQYLLQMLCVELKSRQKVILVRDIILWFSVQTLVFIAINVGFDSIPNKEIRYEPK